MNTKTIKEKNDNFTHLRLELERLKTLLHRDILWQRNLWNDKNFEGYRGMVIPDSQVDAILSFNSIFEEQQKFYNKNKEAGKLKKKYDLLTEHLNEIYLNAQKNNIFIPLPYLAKLFGLNDFEYNLIILTLAPEIEREFENLYGYAEDNINLNYPTTRLALRLFNSSEHDIINARKCFEKNSPLFLFRILSLEKINGSAYSRQIKMDERILNFISGPTPFEINNLDHMKFIKPLLSEESLHPKNLIRITNLLKSIINNNDPIERNLLINIFGKPGIGKKTITATAVKECEFAVLVIDLSKILTQQIETVEEALLLSIREAIIQSAIPYFEITSLSDEMGPAMDIFERVISNLSIPIFLATDERWQPRRSINDHRIIPIELTAISFKSKLNYWKERVGEPGLESELKLLSSTFDFTPGEINKAVERAGDIALQREPGSIKLTADDLWEASRNLPRHKLGELAQKIEPVYKMDDIILSVDKKDHLLEIYKQVKYKSKVYKDWGLAEKISRGKGLSVLFSGKSGTGKTMAAEVIANELSLDLYRIDLSSIVNKYIGETEKNLKKVFDEAEKSNAILFFDEADALFGKRSEVKDSHDRYSNIEINYLLQKMEEYTGLCILATNMPKALDDAFMRRIKIAVEFPIPDIKLRKLIWEKSFEPHVPHNGIDFDFLARQFEISGGNIRNITLNAAFLAAADDGEVRMKHIVKASKREFNKIGKLCLESEFGPYYSMINK